MRLAVLTMAVGLLGLTPPTWAQSGHVAQFLGWSLDSREFAYTTTGLRKGRSVTQGFIKKIRNNGRASFRRYNGSVSERAKRLKYKVTPLRLAQREKYQRVFILDPQRRLEVSLDVGKHLGFTIALVDSATPEKRKVLHSGVFRELWVDFDAKAFVSPNGKWIAVQMMMGMPQSKNEWFEGLRVGLP